MKIILSRKGFDSGIGRVASPILPTGEMYSLPIPEALPGQHSKRYNEIQAGAISLGTLVNDLTEGRVKPERFAHLDPDLRSSYLPRPEDWRPIFGQAGAAERHLQNQGISKGDVFLFYGWFRKVELASGKYRYIKHEPDLHVLFGWLQIEQRLSVQSLGAVPAWAREHPHCKGRLYRALDSIYLSTTQLHLPVSDPCLPGAGVFPKFSSDLCLTAPNQSRSNWRLPAWFFPHPPRTGLSYHNDLRRWTQEEDSVLLRSVGRGQEFVLDCEQYPEAIPWLHYLLSLGSAEEQASASTTE